MKKRSLFGEMWDLWVERRKIHKALRLLSKQEWSVEFLTAMLYRAGRMYGSKLEMEIVSPAGQKIVVRMADNTPAGYKDDDIMNHLDDEVKINQFLHQLRGNK